MDEKTTVSASCVKVMGPQGAGFERRVLRFTACGQDMRRSADCTVTRAKCVHTACWLKHTHAVTDGHSLRTQPGHLKTLHRKWQRGITLKHTHTRALGGSTQGHTDGRCYTNTSHWSMPYYQLSQPASYPVTASQ